MKSTNQKMLYSKTQLILKHLNRTIINNKFKTKTKIKNRINTHIYYKVMNHHFKRISKMPNKSIQKYLNLKMVINFNLFYNLSMIQISF